MNKQCEANQNILGDSWHLHQCVRSINQHCILTKNFFWNGGGGPVTVKEENLPSLQQRHNNHTAMPHQCHNNATTRLQQPNNNATAMCHHTRVPPSTRTCQHRRSLALSGLHGQPICFKTDQDYVNMPKIWNLRKIMEIDYEHNLLIARITLRHKHL